MQQQHTTNPQAADRSSGVEVLERLTEEWINLIVWDDDVWAEKARHQIEQIKAWALNCEQGRDQG